MRNKVWYLPKFQEPSGSLPEIKPIVSVRDNTRTRFTPPDYIPQQNRPVRPGSGDGITELVFSFVPGVGEAMGLDNTYKAFKNDGFCPGMFELGITGLGMVPVVGDVAGKGLRAAVKGSKATNLSDDVLKALRQKHSNARYKYRKDWTNEEWGQHADNIWRELENDPNFDAIVEELSDADDWYDLSEWQQIRRIKERLNQPTSRPERYNPYLNLWDDVIE